MKPLSFSRLFSLCTLWLFSFFLPLTAHAQTQPTAGQDLATAAPTATPATETQGVIGMAHPWQLNFQKAYSPVMETLETTHNMLLFIIFAVSIFVLAIVLYIMVRFNRKANPVPSTTSHNTTLEIIWTTIPILILIAIAIPSVRAHYFMEKDPEGGITLKVTGHQWYWSYAYPDFGGFEYDSYLLADDEAKKASKPRLLGVDNPVVVPVNTPVRVLITGADVIHSWAVPPFGVKRDAVPGRLNESWFEAKEIGTFYGQCSELCGKGHGFMPIELKVVSQADFDSWVKKQQDAAGIKPEAANAGAESVKPTDKANDTIVKETENQQEIVKENTEKREEESKPDMQAPPVKEKHAEIPADAATK